MKRRSDDRDLEQASLDRVGGILPGAPSSHRESSREPRSQHSTGLAGGGHASMRRACKDLSDLRRAPLTAESDLVRACHPSRIKSYACSDVQMWFRVTGRGGSYVVDAMRKTRHHEDGGTLQADEPGGRESLKTTWRWS